jgi:ABC-2 type transport system ATP-binding protein
VARKTTLTTMPAIEVDQLVVTYGEKVAVDRLDLSADSGQILALLGPNGAGKTSTVETLEGYRRPSAGRVGVLGLDPVLDRRALAPRIGVMLQRGGVYPTMTPRQALRLFAAYYPRAADPDEMLERVGLDGSASTPWRRLSGGEQQRLSLGLALIGRPEVAFLDEPTAGVDPGGRLAIRQLIGDLRDDGVCVLLTTHELEEAERLADRIVIIDAGTVVAAGTPAELMSSGGPRQIRFGAPAGIDVDEISRILAAPAREERPGEYVVDTEPTPATVAALTAWLADHELPLADLRAGRQRLEDVFLALTGSESSAIASKRSGKPSTRRGRAGSRR